MRTIEITEIAAFLENYNKADHPLILTRNGQPIAALFPVDDGDVETLSLSMNPTFMNIIEKSRRSQEEDGRVFLEDVPISYRLLFLLLGEVRRKNNPSLSQEGSRTAFFPS